MAFWVVQLQVNLIAKYFISVTVSFAVIVVRYEGIKRVGVLRFYSG